MNQLFGLQHRNRVGSAVHSLLYLHHQQRHRVCHLHLFAVFLLLSAARQQPSRNHQQNDDEYSFLHALSVYYCKLRKNLHTAKFSTFFFAVKEIIIIFANGK